MLKTRNAIALCRLVPRALVFRAKDTKHAAELVFNLHVAAPSSYETFNHNLTLQLAPAVDEHSFPAYNTTDLLLLDDRALSFRADKLFLGSNLTLSLLLE